jgi:hypothetical protein
MSDYNQQKKTDYADELQKLQENPEHYMTPGARRYFKRVWLGYLILAVAMTVGMWALANNFDHQLRDNINTFLVESCKQSIPTIKKFNQGIQADIDLQKDALFINSKRGDSARVFLNKRAIEQKRNSKLHVPTLEECENRKAF